MEGSVATWSRVEERCADRTYRSQTQDNRNRRKNFGFAALHQRSIDERVHMIGECVGIGHRGGPFSEIGGGLTCREHGFGQPEGHHSGHQSQSKFTDVSLHAVLGKLVFDVADHRRGGYKFGTHGGVPFTHCSVNSNFRQVMVYPNPSLSSKHQVLIGKRAELRHQLVSFVLRAVQVKRLWFARSGFVIAQFITRKPAEQSPKGDGQQRRQNKTNIQFAHSHSRLAGLIAC